jgi:hypothetical protein
MMSVVSGVVLAGGVALAQPKAPAPAPAPAAGSAAPAGAGAGSAVQPIEDAPPSDMEGTTEDPSNPSGLSADHTDTTAPPAVPMKKSGYPLEETQRPITLPQNMGEVSIAPHFTASPFQSSDALHFRFGLTRQVQLGLTYVWGGFFDDDLADMKDNVKFHAGKAAGLDVVYLLQNWIGVSVGVPVYLSPFAMAVDLGAPMKFRFGKVAVGGMEDVVSIKISKFPPSLYQEAFNAASAANAMPGGTEQATARLHLSGYVAYQQSAKLALIGRIGLDRVFFPSGSGGFAGSGGADSTTTLVRVGLQFSPKKFLDVGASLGFDDLATADSFGLAGFFALRI